MARSRSRPPSSSWATTCCSSRYTTSKLRDSAERAMESEPAPASGFGLNGINRTGQSTTMQLNAQGLTRFDARGIVQYVTVGSRLDDRIATGQRGVRTEGAQARSLGGHLLARCAETLG